MIINPFKVIKRPLLLVVLFIFANPCYADMWEYTVIKGDTLWDIADENFIDVLKYKDLQALNKVENPYLLQPGREIVAPFEWLNNLPGQAHVTSKTGHVNIERTEATKDENLAKDKIYPDDSLITQANSAATVEFSDQSKVNIYSESKVKFKLINESVDGKNLNLRISVEKGRIDVKANPAQTPGHRLEIETPSAVTAVRGTSFRISVDQSDGDTVAEILSGRVKYRSSGIDTDLNKGLGIKSLANGNTIAPVQLLPAPIIVAKQTHDQRLGSMEWKGIENADRYRVRVSAGIDFSEVIYDRIVSANRVNDIYFHDNGTHIASVRSIDSNDIEGYDATTQLDVRIYPLPPLLSHPKNQTVVKTFRPEFSWRNLVKKVAKVRFQLARDNKFDSKVIDEVIEASKNTYKIKQDLQKGLYYWRLAGIDEQGHRGSFSSALMFNIK